MSQKKQQIVPRNVTILARYTIKKDGMYQGVLYHAGELVLLVRNDKGVEYFVTLRRNRVHSCTCPHVPSRKCRECYHITECKAIENARAAERVAATKREAAAKLAAEVEAICAEVEADLASEKIEAPQFLFISSRSVADGQILYTLVDNEERPAVTILADGEAICHAPDCAANCIHVKSALRAEYQEQARRKYSAQIRAEYEARLQTLKKHATERRVA